MQIDGELIRQARGLFEKGDFAAAEEAYHDLLERLPKDRRIDATLIIGACQQAQGRDEEAIATLEAAVAMDSSRAESWFQLGRARRQAGEDKRAAEALGQAIVSDPNHALARVELGRLALAAGDGEGAERHFRTALRADPDCVPALVSLASRLLDIAQVDAAYEQITRAVQIRPQSVEAQLVMARAFDRRGHPDFAERSLSNALAAAPDNAELNRAMAQLLLARGRTEEAMRTAAQARQRGISDPRMLLIEARGLQRLGHIPEAHHRLETLARDHPSILDQAAVLTLAELRLARRDVEGARNLLEKLDEAWPAVAQLIGAQLAEADGQHERAAELAAGLHDDSDGHIRRQARLLSAHLALARDDADACVAAVEPLAEANTADSFAHWLLARALDRAGRYDDARAWLEGAGWRTPPELAQLEADLPAALYDALARFSFDGWARQAPEDGYPQPVFLLGWPGSGRNEVLSALSRHAGNKLLSRGDALRRREALGLPAEPSDLDELSAESLRRARKRYFRAAPTGAPRLLEPLWLAFADLPAIARCFPGSVVVLLDADYRDLELDWRLAGSRGIEGLRALWQREQDLLEHFLEHLPLEFQVFSRSDLEADSSEAANEFARLLGLENPAALAEDIDRNLATLRPTGHWRHYGDLFVDEASG